MDSTTENPVIDPKLQAQLDNLETHYNPDFDLWFDEWLATQSEEQVNGPSAEQNGSSVTQPPPKKPKLSLLLHANYKHDVCVPPAHTVNTEILEVLNLAVTALLHLTRTQNNAYIMSYLRARAIFKCLSIPELALSRFTAARIVTMFIDQFEVSSVIRGHHVYKHN